MYISFPPNGYMEYSEGLAVEFVKKDGSKWVGNFARGNSNFIFACQLKDTEDIVIIAYGICYIVNLEDSNSFVEFGFDFNEVFQHNSTIIIIGEYSISIVKNKTEIIHFDSLCYGGIGEMKLEENQIVGILNDYDSSGNDIERSFILNLSNLEFKRINNKNKWWKIW